MKSKQVFDVKANKGAFPVALSDEHTRSWNEKQWQRKTNEKGCNYDPTRKHLNFEVTRGGRVQTIDHSKNIPERFLERCSELGIGNPNVKIDPRTGEFIDTNRVTTVSIVFGGSRERMNVLAFGNQPLSLDKGADNSNLTRHKDIEGWAKDVYRFACDQWGEENVIGFYVHLDETNVHAHCTVIPVAEVKGKPRISFNKAFWGLRDKGTKLTALHDSLAKVNERWGLERGDKIAETGAKHVSTEEYRRNLSCECSELEREIVENKGRLRSLNDEIAFATKRVKGLQTMIANLSNEEYELERELHQLRKDLQENRGDNDAIQRRIADGEHRLKAILEVLGDKSGKLSRAQAELARLARQKDEAEEEIAQYREAIKDASTEVLKLNHQRVANAILPLLLDDFQSRYADLGPMAKSTFDDSLLTDLCTRGNDILACATLLVAGYVDAATQMAESKGGGGSSDNDHDWGRRKDEDERLWATRCLQRARQMMMPRKSRGKRR